MPKDILVYQNIDTYSSSEFIAAINEWTEKVLIIRVNTNGGEPAYMWGMIAKFNEFEGEKIIKIDGKAYSGGFYLGCYATYVECLDVSEGLVHRAAYPDWFEKDPEYFTDEIRRNLANINKNLEAAFRAKVDVEAFENLKQVKDKNITVKDIFSMDSRIDVFLSAKDMKKIGLVDKIVTITPAITAEIESRIAVVMARYTGVKPVEVKKETKVEPIKNKPMTKEEFKAAHPVEYAAIVAEGIAQEKERVEGIMVFSEIAPKVCKEAIESGKNLSEKAKNEIYLEQMKKGALTTVVNESAEPVATVENKVVVNTTEVTKKVKEVEGFEAEVMAELKDVKLN